ncbi:MAG: flagellar basal body protein FliL [Treponema sp.]|jgi:flagellar basal body-associated protein FliL|nr:flagellar basal body protein FliL [Treponema sp.]
MMKQAPPVPRPPVPLVYPILLSVLAALALVIAGGTVYALVFRGPAVNSPPETFPAAVSTGTGARTFASLGQIRTLTQDASTVILSIAFPYDAGDRAFTEELSARIEDFRALSVEYFAACSVAGLGPGSEGTIKQELLERFNAVLRLGQIEALYFSDYMIIE